MKESSFYRNGYFSQKGLCETHECVEMCDVPFWNWSEVYNATLAITDKIMCALLSFFHLTDGPGHLIARIARPRVKEKLRFNLKPSAPRYLAVLLIQLNGFKLEYSISQLSANRLLRWPLFAGCTALCWRSSNRNCQAFAGSDSRGKCQSSQSPPK